MSSCFHSNSAVNIRISIITVSVLLFASCSFTSDNHTFLQPEVINLPQTKVGNSFQLSKDDIEEYLRVCTFDKDKHHKIVKSISPVEMDGIIVYYIVNYDKGWIVLSADKRGPTVLAESPTGAFDYQRLSEEEKSWFDSIGMQILSRIRKPNEYYAQLSDEGQENERINSYYWELICDNRRDISYVQCDTLIYESVDHLIPVYWHQNSPFNAYCPLTASSGTTRCPAGCVAIAGAQIWYYLHGHIGRPYASPSTGYCTGWYMDYSQSFSDYYPNWDLMNESTDPYGYAALLIGAIGQMVDMEYTPGGSWAYTSDLVPYVFNAYGINCTYTIFNSDDVFNELKLGFPIICRGTEDPEPSSNGHTFIIDGYVSKYIRSYIYYSDGGYNIFQSLPFISSVRINWGLGLEGRSATYAINGTWQGYDYNRKMIYHFRLENK